MSIARGLAAAHRVRRLAQRRRSVLATVGTAAAALACAAGLSQAFSAAPRIGTSDQGSVEGHSHLGGGPVVGGSGAVGSGLVGHRHQDSLLPTDRSRTALRAIPEALSSFQEILEQVPDKVAELGPLGPLYFFAIYVIAECLALPATPLTLSSGYLFGLPMGCAVAILAGTTAAGIGFMLSKTFLRPQIMKLVEDNETFQNINRAVEREGFKIVFLLRLSPLLPFALSNYVYGLSNVGFLEFLAATGLGFAPGTCSLVYLASTAKDVMEGNATNEWYVYAGGVAATLFLVKIVADIASKAVEEAIEADKAGVATTR